MKETENVPDSNYQSQHEMKEANRLREIKVNQLSKTLVFVMILQ
jgi:hypothetical protein